MLNFVKFIFNEIYDLKETTYLGGFFTVLNVNIYNISNLKYIIPYFKKTFYFDCFDYLSLMTIVLLQEVLLLLQLTIAICDFYFLSFNSKAR